MAARRSTTVEADLSLKYAIHIFGVKRLPKINNDNFNPQQPHPSHPRHPIHPQRPSSSLQLFNSMLCVFVQEQIQWKTDHLHAASSTTGQAVYPESVCSQPCHAGHRAVRTQPSCCFYCEACRENERTVMSDNLPKCEKCPTGSNFTWPDDETRTECLPIDPSFLSVTELSGALIFAFDLLVLFLTCSTTVIYIKNGRTFVSDW